ncbi:MAG: ArnT family glycosyltransferase [Acidobacteriota bacterium]
MIPQSFYILFGAAFTVATMVALGRLLLARLGLRFHRREELVFAFVSGAACLSFVVFLIAGARGAYKGVFLALGIAAIALARRLRRPAEAPLAPVPRAWRIFAAVLFAAFTYLYFFNAMAPETSPDGSAYHLGLVSRYARAHGIYRITTDMYAHLSQGVELLFLFAYTFGRHSAASLVHYSFLCALPLAMICYARRFGFASAGIAGALLVYMSPVVGFDGTSAYIDVAVACVLFAIFYLLQIWDEERAPGLLVLIGLLAGFAYAMKYTAFVAVPYTIGFVGWKSWRKGGTLARPVAMVALPALVMIAPWVLRNWIWYGNPFSPFYNAWFPNPYIHIGLEQGYRAQLTQWGGVTNKLDIPVEATVRGDKLQGILGPIFLLAPIALAALRYRQGRQLLLAAAVFFSTYPANIGTRFLIPGLPFLSLAMGMALANWRAMAPLVVAAHALSAWPPYMRMYSGQYGLQLRRAPIKAALRIESEERYLERSLDGYGMARLIEITVPPGEKVLAFDTPREAYTSRTILQGYRAAWNNNASDLLNMPRIREWQPSRRFAFRFPEQRLRRIRVVQTVKRGAADNWSIHELRVLSGERELPRAGRWRLHAKPNPWEVGYAFDNNPMTRWRSWEPAAEGQSVEIDFGGEESAGAVYLDTEPQGPVKFTLEGQTAPAGPWRTLAQAPEETQIPVPADMRRIISSELRRQGIGYIMTIPEDPAYRDLSADPSAWGIVLAREYKGARLYRIATN